MVKDVSKMTLWRMVSKKYLLRHLWSRYAWEKYPRTDSNIIPSMGTGAFTKKGTPFQSVPSCTLGRTSNRRFRLRRPTLYPLSYEGICEGDFTINVLQDS